MTASEAWRVQGVAAAVAVGGVGVGMPSGVLHFLKANVGLAGAGYGRHPRTIAGAALHYPSRPASAESLVCIEAAQPNRR